jgi:hypothetical protein
VAIRVRQIDGIVLFAVGFGRSLLGLVEDTVGAFRCMAHNDAAAPAPWVCSCRGILILVN